MDSKDIRLVYIMSPSYSGSTLLTTLLAQQTRIATVGELKANKLPDIATYTCSCGSRILECDFWNRLIRQVRDQGSELDLADFATRFRSEQPLLDRVLRPNVKAFPLETLRHLLLLAVPPFRKRFFQIMSQNHQIVSAACKLYETDTFLDGSKDPLRALFFHRYTNYDLRVIYLTRDGRGTLNSDKKYNGLSTREAAISWKRKIEEMDRVARLLPEKQLYRLRYESFCEAPEEKLRELMDFAGLRTRETPLGASDLHILGNNNMRLVKTSEIRLDEKWKQNLSKEDLSEFQVLAGDTNARLGYA
ncbi:MAG: sulfotransferase [Ketobacteraceae bacterium]|nr:sulfotransferase [Ketobacteraceae bacterium]